MLKLDDSGAGDGNVVLDLRTPGELRAALDALPDWYLRDLAQGGVVEELIAGTRFASPSAQIDVLPDGQRRRARHARAGARGRGRAGLHGLPVPRRPRRTPPASRTTRRMVGERLAARGVVGRASVDFAAALDASGAWSVHALEVNLRKGGTTHPYSALRNLVPGRYDEDAGALDRRRWQRAVVLVDRQPRRPLLAGAPSRRS